MTASTTAPTAPTTSTAVPLRRRPGVRFALHYVEMVLAMAVGMVVLAPAWLVWAGRPRDGLGSLAIMITDMTVGMAIWMLLRGHSRPATAEMCAAMVVPFGVLLLPYAGGQISLGGLTVAGHVLMLPAMLLVMLRRRSEYAGHAH
jgi:flagellar biosynthetic protein FliP